MGERCKVSLGLWTVTTDVWDTGVLRKLPSLSQPCLPACPPTPTPTGTLSLLGYPCYNSADNTTHTDDTVIGGEGKESKKYRRRNKKGVWRVIKIMNEKM